jgi:organic hydroperoxide reductase OsmC/OhrA
MKDIFSSHLDWIGARHGSTAGANGFSRNLTVTVGGRGLAMSSAPAFHGDERRINPEQLFVAAISACQALTFLSIAGRKQVEVVSYSDDADGWLEGVDGHLRMSRVVLRPRIVLAKTSDQPLAQDLVERAHSQCFIGNSVTAVVTIEPLFEHAERSAA